MRISDWSSDVCSSDLLGRERELVLRDHDDDYLDPDRRENLQLAVHDVSRPDPVRTADDVDDRVHAHLRDRRDRSEEHTSELQSLMRTSYAVFCLKKKNKTTTQNRTIN